MRHRRSPEGGITGGEDDGYLIAWGLSGEREYSQKNKNLLEKLRSARLEAGLTQIEAGKKLRKPQSYLSKVERGERKIEAIELADFAKIYNKDINYFIT